jgi:hypothetical protein
MGTVILTLVILLILFRLLYGMYVKTLTLINLMVAAAVSLVLGITTEVRVTSVFDPLNCPDSSTYCYLSSQKICFVLPSFAVYQYNIFSLSSLNH